MLTMNRRAMMTGVGAAMMATQVQAADTVKKPAMKLCLNTSTIRNAQEKSRPITEAIDIAAKAGYAAIEPWIREIDEYTAGGGKLEDLKKRIADAGLQVPDAIGFAEWVVDDPVKRAKGLETAKRDMDKVLAIGGTRIAAPPVGATNASPPVSANAAADRYKELLEIGLKIGVTPIVEVWGFSKSLSRLGECMLVAIECGKDGGCVLPDIYHLYKGGSDFAGLKLLGANSIGIFHVNDYPKIERGKIVDADRVYPGDGVAPLKEVFAALQTMGYSGYLSLELFNRGYWKQDPLEVAKTGHAKLQKLLTA